MLPGQTAQVMKVRLYLLEFDKKKHQYIHHGFIQTLVFAILMFLH